MVVSAASAAQVASRSRLPWCAGMMPTVERFVVVAHELVTPVIVSLWLQPVADHVVFVPGQYVLLEDCDHAIPPRSYSVANVPRDDGHLRLLVTLVADGVTSRWVHDDLAPGVQVRVSGPYGTFTSDDPGVRPTLGLAGGSGIAPILALAEDALRHGVGVPFTVFFSGRTGADVIDGQRLTAWDHDHANFTFLRTLTRAPGPPPVGRIPGVLADHVTDLADHEVFIAGAPSFVADCARVVRQLGGRPGLVHTEEFFADPRPW